jgi:Mrp family chromosome partitioning ATPase
MTTRKKVPFDHTGSSFDSSLQEEGILDEVEASAIKRLHAGQLVLEDADARQRQLDIAAQADAKEGIRQGLEDAKNGRLQPIREFFAEFEAEHGIKQ